MERACMNMADYLPLFFRPNDRDERPFALHRDDLSQWNIFVDEQSSEITAIVDWEATCTSPWWKGSTYTTLLQQMMPQKARYANLAEEAAEEEDHNDEQLADKDYLAVLERCEDAGVSIDLAPIYFQHLSRYQKVKKSFDEVFGKVSPSLSSADAEAIERKWLVEKMIQDIDQFWGRELYLQIRYAKSELRRGCASSTVTLKCL